MHTGLAVYTVGTGEPMLLMPYPHGYTLASAAAGALAERLRRHGRRLITFDAPGAYRSDRPCLLTMAEMVEAAAEALDRCGEQQVTLVGHSMGGLCSLVFALEHPERVRRLVLIGAVSGGAAIDRYRGMPHSLPKLNLDFWRFVWWGMQLGLGRADLKLHKRMVQLIQRRSYFDPTQAPLVPIDPGDAGRPAPVRDRWPMVARKLDYSGRLGEVHVPTLVCVGRHDPQAPVAAARELAAGIPGAQLAIFERSGHYPFAEEPQRFEAVLAAFLGR